MGDEVAKPKRDLKELERRRMKAVKLLEQGSTQAEVARELGVSRESVRRWADRAAEGGKEALRRPAKLGRPAGLGDAERASLAKQLKAGALAQGYATELWTVPRVRQLVKDLFGMSYSESQVWRILRAMGWSPQRPEKRARERNEKAISLWKRQRWPQVKKTLPPREEPSFS